MAPYKPPCAACKVLRRKCIPSDCIFWAHFPPQDHQKFANVRKVYGASNVAKLLKEVPPQQRQEAVNSLAYEAEARVRDPVYGCVGVIATLQTQVQRLQKELDAANADLIQLVSVGGEFYQTPSMQMQMQMPNDIYYNPYDGIDLEGSYYN